MARYANQFTHPLVHTGQHYDYGMSQVFFEHLEMPAPDEFLNTGSGFTCVSDGGYREWL